MNKILTIAWRDFRLTVLRPAFLIGVIGIPVLITALIAISIVLMMAHKEPPLVGTIVLVSEEPALTAALQERLDKAGSAEQMAREVEEQISGIGERGPGNLSGSGSTSLPLARGAVQITVEGRGGAAGADVPEIEERVRSADLLAASVVPPEVFEPSDPDPPAEAPRFQLLVGERVDSDHTRLVERALGDAIVDVRAARRGEDPKAMRALFQRPRSTTRRLLESGGEATEDAVLRELRAMVPMVFFGLLWIACFTAGQHLMMSTIEEKSNRVMEVLLSAVSPLQLMAGKILGQGGVGLVILVIYSSLGVASLVAFAFMRLIEPVNLLYMFVYFFMAYFMVAAIMAAVGSAVSDIREANTLLTPVMIVLMLLWGLWWPISNDPNGAVATGFSFVPPAIPFAMLMRLTADEPVPLWQVPATIAWGYLCVLLMVWAAAKVFRVGVLMYGKPPSVLELAKWVRYR